MKAWSLWCVVVPALAHLLAGGAPVSNAQGPISPIPPSEATQVLREWLRQSHYYYSFDERYITVGQPRYVNRGYAFELRAACLMGGTAVKCPSGSDSEELGRWRVDAVTREVFIQDMGGRYFPAQLTRPPSVASAGGAPVPPGYRLNATVQLEGKFAGIDGRLELLEDERVTPPSDIIKYIPGNGGCEYFPTAEERRLCESLSSLRGPVLRLVDASGREVSELVLAGPLGDLSVEHLYTSGRPTYFVTDDPVCRVSSYCGPHIHLAEVQNGRLVWLQAENPKTHQLEPWILLKSGKSQWQVSRSPRGGCDVLEAWCEGNANLWKHDLRKHDLNLALDFDSVYRRYSFEGGRWVSYEQREPGYMEFSQVGWFPPRTKFP